MNLYIYAKANDLTAKQKHILENVFSKINDWALYTFNELFASAMNNFLPSLLYAIAVGFTIVLNSYIFLFTK